MTARDDIPDEEREPCPTCGIWLYYWRRCHPSNFQHYYDGCGDPWHKANPPLALAEDERRTR